MGTKWAKTGAADKPVQEFARQVLTERMAIVESLLPLAAYHYHEDEEHVHQLRVGCRRACGGFAGF